MKTFTDKLIDKLLQEPWIDIFIILMLILTGIVIWGVATFFWAAFSPI